jgi:hypothetical protein
MPEIMQYRIHTAFTPKPISCSAKHTLAPVVAIVDTSGVMADFFFVLFLVVDGIVTMKTIVTHFTVIFEATMIIVSRRRTIVSRMISQCKNNPRCK